MSGITDEELVAQYAKADITAFASTLEGFGMPIIEGQLVGRPVVTGDRHRCLCRRSGSSSRRPF